MSKLLQIINFLEKKEKKRIFLLIILIIITSIIEAITINAVIPVLSILTGTMPSLDIKFLNTLLQEQNLETILTVFSILIILSAIFKLYTLKCSINISFNIGLLTSKKIIKNIIQTDYENRLKLNDSEVIGTIIVKINDLIRNINNLFNIITAFFSIILIIIILITYNPKITIVTILLFSLIYIIIFLFSKKIISDNSETINNKVNLSSQNIQEILTNFTDIKINNLHKFFEKKFFQNESDLRKTQINSTIIGVFPKYIIESIGLLFIALIIYYLNTNGINSETIPLVGFLALSAQKILPYIQQAYTGYVDIKSNGSSFKSIIDYINIKKININLINKTNNANKKISFSQNICLNKISYKYSNGKFTKQISFKIKKGERVGIIGKSGIGKTTLLNMMMGIIRPTSGSILIDNQVLDHNNLESWHRLISYVPQSIHLIEASIYENIAFGIETNLIDYKKIKDICTFAQIDHLLNFNNSYSNDEKREKYSGGEMQRLAISRALYKDADVLFFDEITSSLDKESEKFIIDNIKKIGKDKTIIMISHNTSNFIDFDRVINLDLC